MSLYQVQKLIQAVNRDPQAREKYFSAREALIDEYLLEESERSALRELVISELYDMGVHPLLLRPFTIINGVSEKDYLAAIRAGGES